jgi:hypothetical protein
MKPEKPKTIPLDIVLSNRLRIELEEKFAQVSVETPLKDLVKLLLLCDNFIHGNEVHKHPTIKKNVKIVKAVRLKTLKYHDAKKP